VLDVSSQLRTFYSTTLKLFFDLLSKKLLTIHFHTVPFLLPPTPCNIPSFQVHSVTLGPQCEIKNSTHTKSRYVLLLST